jgi:DNA polymerase III alpha subunit
MKELSVELNDRTLRFDGVSIVPPEFVQDFMLRGLPVEHMRLSSTTDETEQFNLQAGDALRLVSGEQVNLNFSWKLPPEFLSLDVVEHVSVVFGERLPALKYDATQTELAIHRVAQELQQFRNRGLLDLLRVIIYTLHRFRETGQVFGVGRGSSCASYILFLLGLHVVDPIKFKVDLEEFMHA